MDLKRLLLWLVKLPPLAGYRSYIGLGILAVTGVTVGLQSTVDYLAGQEAAALVAAVPVLGQVIGWKGGLATIGTWLALVGAAFNNESPRMLKTK